MTLIPGRGRRLRAKVGVRLTCTSRTSGLGGRGGDGLAAARPAGERPEGLTGREEEVFFSSFLVSILQLGYGRYPGLDAVRFKAAVAYTPLTKSKFYLYSFALISLSPQGVFFLESTDYCR